jgi:hypothetical protein
MDEQLIVVMYIVEYLMYGDSREVNDVGINVVHVIIIDVIDTINAMIGMTILLISIQLSY